MKSKDSRFWDKFATWKEAEQAWDEKKSKASEQYPIKVLKSLPSMVGISADTKKHLRWKGLLWMLSQDKNWTVMRHVVWHPLRHLFRYARSLVSKSSYIREGDFYYYGMKTQEQFQGFLKDPNTVLVLGFAYCHKPFECPSGRFSAQCISSCEHPACAQCFIGKCVQALPLERTEILIVPTVHYVGRKLFEIRQSFPKKRIVFLMTACEMMLEMFGDWANMIKVKGIGVRLGGRVCNTFKSFELSERGIKPGLTVVLPEAERRILKLIEFWRKNQL